MQERVIFKRLTIGIKGNNRDPVGLSFLYDDRACSWEEGVQERESSGEVVGTALLSWASQGAGPQIDQSGTVDNASK